MWSFGTHAVVAYIESKQLQRMSGRSRELANAVMLD